MLNHSGSAVNPTHCEKSNFTVHSIFYFLTTVSNTQCPAEGVCACLPLAGRICLQQMEHKHKQRLQHSYTKIGALKSLEYFDQQLKYQFPKSNVGSTSAQISFGYKLPCLSTVLKHSPADYLHRVQTHQAHGCMCGVHTHTKNLYTRRVTEIQTISLYCIPFPGDRQLLTCFFPFLNKVLS